MVQIEPLQLFTVAYTRYVDMFKFIIYKNKEMC